MTMNLIPGVESTGSALSAEKIRLEIIAKILRIRTPRKMLMAMCTNEKSPSKSMLRFLKEEFPAMWMKIYIKEYELQMFLTTKLLVE